MARPSKVAVRTGNVAVTVVPLPGVLRSGDATHRPDPRPKILKPHARPGAPDVEALSVVVNLDHQAVGVPFEGNATGGSGPVSAHIGQRFTDDLYDVRSSEESSDAASASMSATVTTPERAANSVAISLSA